MGIFRRVYFVQLLLTRVLYAVSIPIFFTAPSQAIAASKAEVSITVKNRPFRVSGDNIAAVVRSMKRNGPISEDHGRRAIGLADYRYRTSVVTKKSDGLCRVVSVKVSMTIYYYLPALSSSSRLSKADASKWNRIETMIRLHEHQHGRSYRRLATEVQRSLARMKPQRNCRQFKVIERHVRTRLEKADKSRNRRYDRATYSRINNRLRKIGR